jgi:hypothetical protein
MWPEVVQYMEVQSRLINDGVPVERAMKYTSEIARLQLGDRYRIERAQGDLFLYARGDGWFHVATS